MKIIETVSWHNLPRKQGPPNS